MISCAAIDMQDKLLTEPLSVIYGYKTIGASFKTVGDILTSRKTVVPVSKPTGLFKAVGPANHSTNKPEVWCLDKFLSKLGTQHQIFLLVFKFTCQSYTQ